MKEKKRQTDVCLYRSDIKVAIYHFVQMEFPKPGTISRWKWKWMRKNLVASILTILTMKHKRTKAIHTKKAQWTHQIFINIQYSMIPAKRDHDLGLVCNVTQIRWFFLAVNSILSVINYVKWRYEQHIKLSTYMWV